MAVESQNVDLNKLIDLENELTELKRTQGIVEKQPLWIKIGDVIMKHVREPITVSRKKYIILAISCGWFTGAHRFYTKQKFWGVLYFLTCWTGIAAAMTIVDLFLLFMKYEPDENGMVTI